MGAALRKLRIRAGHTQEDIAEALGTSQPYVSSIESGRRSPSWRYLLRFAETIGANIVTLLRAAGLIGPDLVELEQEIAALVEEEPRLRAIFEYAKDDREVLADLARYAEMLIREREARHEYRGEPTEGED